MQVGTYKPPRSFNYRRLSESVQMFFFACNPSCDKSQNKVNSDVCSIRCAVPSTVCAVVTGSLDGKRRGRDRGMAWRVHCTQDIGEDSQKEENLLPSTIKYRFCLVLTHTAKLLMLGMSHLRLGRCRSCWAAFRPNRAGSRCPDPISVSPPLQAGRAIAERAPPLETLPVPPERRSGPRSGLVAISFRSRWGQMSMSGFKRCN